MSKIRRKKKKIRIPAALLSWPRYVGCNLHLFWVWVLTGVQREKPQYYTSSCSNFSSLLLNCCGRSVKLEAELIMKQVNRSQDPILIGITLRWLCSGIEVLSMKENSTYLLLGLKSVCFPLLWENGCFWGCFIIPDSQFKIFMRLCCLKWSLVSLAIKIISSS